MSELITIIRFNEDGDLPSVEQMTKDEFLDRLNEDYYGDEPEFAEPRFRKIDTGSFTGIVVIDGPIIKPKPEEVVTKYKLGD